jgi:hypothetical protein
MFGDLPHGMRALLQAKSWTAVIVVRLRNAGQNDMVTSSSDYGFSKRDSRGRNVRATFSFPIFQQFVAENRTMTDLFACSPLGQVNVIVDGQAELATAIP